MGYVSHEILAVFFQIAEALDLSRYTIFAYLKEIRHGDAGDEATMHPAAGRSAGGRR